MAQEKTYTYGQNLGKESRQKEFKMAAGFIQHNFRKNISQYVCGFANSHVNGTLYLGVNDSGEVEGYNRCSQREEDHLRVQIDEAVKDIQPGIFPQHYRVDFIPVVDKNGRNNDDTVVIRISVQGEQLDDSQLYSTKEGVFMRRDGSQQLLTAQQIQEWTRQKYQGELDKLRMNEENLKAQLSKKNTDLGNQVNKFKVKEQAMLDKKNLEMKILADENKLLQAEMRTLQQEVRRYQEEKVNDHEEIYRLRKEGAENSAETANKALREDLSEIRQLIKEQGAFGGRNMKQSRVCVIS